MLIWWMVPVGKDGRERSTGRPSASAMSTFSGPPWVTTTCARAAR